MTTYAGAGSFGQLVALSAPEKGPATSLRFFPVSPCVPRMASCRGLHAASTPLRVGPLLAAAPTRPLSGPGIRLVSGAGLKRQGAFPLQRVFDPGISWAPGRSSQPRLGQPGARAGATRSARLVPLAASSCRCRRGQLGCTRRDEGIRLVVSAMAPAHTGASHFPGNPSGQAPGAEAPRQRSKGGMDLGTGPPVSSSCEGGHGGWTPRRQRAHPRT